MLKPQVFPCKAEVVKDFESCAVHGPSTQPVRVRSKEGAELPGDGEGGRPVEASGTETRVGRVIERTGRNATEG
jgi:hypothetical protein